MRPGDEEPNSHYRPWLEEHIGKQDVDWEWSLKYTDIEHVDIGFIRADDATLFELKWP